MTHYPAPKFRDFRHPGRGDIGRSRSAVEAETKLAPGAALIIALLLSLGLWGAIWVAVSPLFAAWLR